MGWRRRRRGFEENTVKRQLVRAMNNELNQTRNFEFTDTDTLRWGQFLEALSWINDGKSYVHLIPEMPRWACYKHNSPRTTNIHIEIRDTTFTLMFETGAGYTWTMPSVTSDIQWPAHQGIITAT